MPQQPISFAGTFSIALSVSAAGEHDRHRAREPFFVWERLLDYQPNQTERFMKKLTFLAVTAAIAINGFAPSHASAWQLTPPAVANETEASIILVGSKRKNKTRRKANKTSQSISRQTARNLNNGAFAVAPQVQNGEMAECLDAAEAQGLGPRSSLEACFQLVLGKDGDTFPADPDTTD